MAMSTLCLFVAIGTAHAQQLSLASEKTIFEPGEQVAIRYAGAAKGDQIMIYHDLAMLPIKESCKVENGDGLFEVPAVLQPGGYTVVLADSQGQKITSLWFSVGEYPQKEGGKRILVIGDPHVMDPSLIESTESSAYQLMIEGSRKLLAESADIFKAYIDTIKILKPDLVIIPGDMTNDGEWVSHQLVVSYLQQLADAGIPTLVIPGNHDMENPSARVYTATGSVPVETITPEQFAQIYRNFGYGPQVDREPTSLTYSCEPLEGIVFIGIDDCRIKSRGISSWNDYEYGRITPATLEWVLERLDRAVEEKKAVIVAVHHQLLCHYDGQETLMPSAATENGEQIARLLADHGARVVLTGHMHIPGISRLQGTESGDFITEITSSSTVSYPSQYRMLYVSDDRKVMQVDTRYLHTTPQISQLQEKARQKVDATLDASIASLTGSYISTFNQMLEQFAYIPEFAGILEDVPSDPDSLAAIANKAFGETIRKVLFTHFEGNENLKDASSIIISQLEKDCEKACELVFDHQDETTRAFLASTLYIYMLEKGEKTIKSMLSDITHLGTSEADQTDDLYTTIALADIDLGICEVDVISDQAAPRIYLLSGQYVGSDMQRLPRGIYVIRQGSESKKVLVK
jgi:3',5'-cyclic AMP phosphodiesterase CpdA